MRQASMQRSASTLRSEASSSLQQESISIPALLEELPQQRTGTMGTHTFENVDGVVTARVYDSVHLKSCFSVYSHQRGMSPTQWLLLCNEAQLVSPIGPLSISTLRNIYTHAHGMGDSAGRIQSPDEFGVLGMSYTNFLDAVVNLALESGVNAAAYLEERVVIDDNALDCMKSPVVHNKDPDELFQTSPGHALVRPTTSDKRKMAGTSRSSTSRLSSISSITTSSSGRSSRNSVKSGEDSPSSTPRDTHTSKESVTSTQQTICGFLETLPDVDTFAEPLETEDLISQLLLHSPLNSPTSAPPPPLDPWATAQGYYGSDPDHPAARQQPSLKLTLDGASPFRLGTPPTRQLPGHTGDGSNLSRGSGTGVWTPAGRTTISSSTASSSFNARGQHPSHKRAWTTAAAAVALASLARPSLLGSVSKTSHEKPAGGQRSLASGQASAGAIRKPKATRNLLDIEQGPQHRHHPTLPLPSPFMVPKVSATATPLRGQTHTRSRIPSSCMTASVPPVHSAPEMSGFTFHQHPHGSLFGKERQQQFSILPYGRDARRPNYFANAPQTNMLIQASSGSQRPTDIDTSAFSMPQMESSSATIGDMSVAMHSRGGMDSGTGGSPTGVPLFGDIDRLLQANRRLLPPRPTSNLSGIREHLREQHVQLQQQQHEQHVERHQQLLLLQQEQQQLLVGSEASQSRLQARNRQPLAVTAAQESEIMMGRLREVVCELQREKEGRRSKSVGQKRVQEVPPSAPTRPQTIPRMEAGSRHSSLLSLAMLGSKVPDLVQRSDIRGGMKAGGPSLDGGAALHPSSRLQSESSSQVPNLLEGRTSQLCPRTSCGAQQQQQQPQQHAGLGEDAASCKLTAEASFCIDGAGSPSMISFGFALPSSRFPNKSPSPDLGVSRSVTPLFSSLPRHPTMLYIQGSRPVSEPVAEEDDEACADKDAARQTTAPVRPKKAEPNAELKRQQSSIMPSNYENMGLWHAAVEEEEARFAVTRRVAFLQAKIDLIQAHMDIPPPHTAPARVCTSSGSNRILASEESEPKMQKFRHHPALQPGGHQNSELRPQHTFVRVQHSPLSYAIGNPRGIYGAPLPASDVPSSGYGYSPRTYRRMQHARSPNVKSVWNQREVKAVGGTDICSTLAANHVVHADRYMPALVVAGIVNELEASSRLEGAEVQKLQDQLLKRARFLGAKLAMIEEHLGKPISSKCTVAYASRSQSVNL